MNKQNPGIEWTNYTWNPISGCKHGCAWTMPDGTTANCYAEDVANKLAQSAYPQGFEHHYWKPETLNQPKGVKTPSRIFCGSMADVFGHWVPDEQIRAVLDVVAACPQHAFQFLTKNPQRLRKFDFPPNAWVGVSVPPDEMWGKKLHYGHQRAMMQTSLLALQKCNAKVKWISIEPLSWDMADDLSWEDDLGNIFIPDLKWAVIGAASNGKIYHQPKPEWVENALFILDDVIGAAVFFKGNLRGNAAATPWRQEFPVLGADPITGR